MHFHYQFRLADAEEIIDEDYYESLSSDTIFV